MRSCGLAVSVCIILAMCLAGSPEELTNSWYPLHPGNTWTYRNESLEGQMAHPDFARWTTEETVVSAAPAPERAGIVVTIRTRLLDDGLSPGFLPPNDPARRLRHESRLLVRQNCIYRLDEPVPDLADYCFPMAKGSTWGQTSDTSPAHEFVWTVLGLNADPFGIPGGRTFHFSAHEGSGTWCDRWFEQGVGLLQQVTEHHGTYDEDRRQLASAVIDGRTLTFHLTPARTVPLGDWDCRGPGWQHFSHPDGAPFVSPADCVSYLKSRP